MERRLSRERIESFAGDVLPLRLLGGEAYGKEPVTWTCAGDCVQITSFAGEAPGSFTDGVLLTLLAPGEAVVTAALEGREYRCGVSVREMKTAASGKTLEYFIGDLHDHTTMEHGTEAFRIRQEGFPIDYICQVRDEGKLDFCVVSDHGELLNDREFFRGFAEGEDAGLTKLILFPGCESEVSPLETDRYGIVHKNAGEIVTFNAASYAGVDSWEEFFSRFDNSPFAVCCLAHPQVLGSSAKGMWNFCLDRNNSPRLREMVKLVEMGNGEDRSANLINAYVYSVALDNGFRMSPACNSDSHGPVWGYAACPGKTVVMAPERSREAFLDALRNNRVYATESGNVKLYWSVCDVAAPGTVALTDRYEFHVEAELFHGDPDSVPVKCQVISDYGICVKTLENVDFSSLDFAVESDTARYFYLRLVDRLGRKTWSCPVWTGRPLDGRNADALIPLDKKGFWAVEEKTGADASVLLNDDPAAVWTSRGASGSILVDMGAVQDTAGLGVYHPILEAGKLKAAGISSSEAMSHLPYEYRVSTSADGKDFEEKASGVFRIFGAESVIRFPRHDARFLRLELLSTVGANSCLAAYREAKIAVAELTVFR